MSPAVGVVPLVYGREFSGWFTAVGYPLVSDCTTQDEREVVALTLGTVEQRAALAAAAAQSSNAMA
ncbi:hypothetical protein [Bosea sp. UC22_33]|uniref:hypothetical protein n=1 Tax=Bosea sp. UC22_33 TaxID=3350165 RepID=UPI00366FC822